LPQSVLPTYHQAILAECLASSQKEGLFFENLKHFENWLKSFFSVAHYIVSVCFAAS
jgi:hypothetical protein